MPSTLDTSKSRAIPRLRGFIAALPFVLASCTLITSIDQRPIDTPQPVIDQHPPSGELLQFDIPDGDLENHFFRQGTVAAHLLTTSGTSPRLIVAFPAANTGTGVWFDDVATPAKFGIVAGTQVEGIERVDGMRGVTAHLECDAGSLSVKIAVLGNIRTLRQYIYDGPMGVPPEVVNQVEVGIPLLLQRRTVDGKHRVELRLGGEEGTTVVQQDDKIQIKAGKSGKIRLVVTAVADDDPLTPFTMDELLTAGAADSPRDRQALAFLASKEKFLAGSWRFLTYFGRDTLLSLRMLMPVLKPAAIEGALGSVLERLQADGDVAHEEGIGEFAALKNKMAMPPPADLLTPDLDYKMIDDDFLLAPVLAAYLLDTPEGQMGAKDFLARKTATGVLYADQLKKNLELVIARAEPFAKAPSADTLISIKDGIPVGNWRDSDDGLGGGRKPFDVNVALVPAALQAAARLYKTDLLGPANMDQAMRLEQFVSAWNTAEIYFSVTVPADTARAQVTAYATKVGLDPAEALASLDSDVIYHGVSIDAAGKAVPVMHTDAGFVMVFTDPNPVYLDAVAKQIKQPFPAGLRSAVGVVVANAAYADAATQDKFTRGDYHGAVVWSWQQALLASGLKRQLARTDLPEATRTALKEAETALWKVILELKDQRTGELWSWKPEGGKAVLESFGVASGQSDESNAAQLWSTVYLAVQPPTQ
jgi:hypothetical protein